MNEDLTNLLNVNREITKVLSMVKKQLNIAIEGLTAIDDNVETNIAKKTLDEINNVKPE
tara:strand:+ start:127 stop:303 length:177 start_codon:yes stop_codon:yes gene_type:complete